MTNRDNVLRRRVLLLVLMWCASTLPGFATEPAPGGVRLSKRGDSRFAWYAAQLQSSIKEALNQNNKTRTASISGVVIRIWVDNTGRVTRTQLVGTTGTSSLDSVITDEVLTGLQLKAPPPSDMPMPIAIRLTAHPSRSGLYTAQVQSRIEEALLQNAKTGTALISGVLIRIWVDNTARIIRAELVGTLGDPSLDSAITNEVLPGLQLKAPPPSDMPMPIVVRVTTHRPG
jgi:hypothetical protein